MSEPENPAAPPPETPARRGGSKPPGQTPGPSPGRSPGRFRRWLLRPLVWGTLLLVVVVGSLLLFAQSRLARERARAFAKTRLSEVLRRDVRIGSVDFGFFPPSVEIRDVVIPGPAPGDPPLASVSQIRVLASLRKLRKRIVEIEQVEVVHPQLYLQFNPDGSNNLPDFNFGGGGGESKVDVWIGRLLVEQGVLRLQERSVDFGMTANGIWGRMVGRAERGGRGGSRLDGLATVQEVTLSLPDGKPYVGTVSVKGSLFPKRRRLEIASSRFAAPDLLGLASGSIDWSRGQVAIDLPFRGEGSTEVVNRLGYLEEPLRGTFRGDGRFEMAGGVWKYSGRAEAPRVEILHRTFEKAAATFLGNRERLTVDLEKVEHAGGTVKGVVEVAMRGDGKPGVPVSLDLDLSDLAVETLVADQFPGEPLPVVGRLTGRTSGSVLYAFRSNAPERGKGRADLRLAGRAGSALPLSGDLPVRLDAGVISAEGIQLAAPGQTVSDGRFLYDLTRRSGKVELRVTSSDLAPVTALLEEVPRPAEPTFWLPTSGKGSADVAITLGPASTDTRVIVDLAQVAAPALRADTVRGALSVSDRALEDLRLEITRGDGALLVTGRVPLASGPAGKPSEPLAMAVEASQWPAADLDYFLALFLPPGLSREVRGEVSGRVDLGGIPDRLTGTLDTEIHELVVSDIHLGAAHATVRFDGDDVAVEEATVRSGAGTLALRGTIAGATKAIDFTLDAPALSLAGPPLRDWLGGDFGGRVSLEASAGGTLDHPRATASLRGRSLTFRGAPIDRGEETHLMAEWDGERASLDGELLGLAKVHGGGRLDREGLGMAFDVASQRLEDLLRLGAPQPIPDLTGSLLGTTAFDADFQDRDFRAVIRLSDLQVDYRGKNARNLEPVVVEIDPRQLKIQSFYLGASVTPAPPGSVTDELFVAGTVGLTGKERPLDLRVQSTLSASWVELVVPKLVARGSLDVLSTIKGTLAAPILNGTGELREASLFFNNRSFPQRLDGLSAVVSFNRDRLELEKLSSRLGGATLVGNGELQLPREGRPLGYKLNLIAEGLSQVFPEGVRNRANANLTLASTESGRSIRGEVDLKQSLYVDDMKVDLLSLLQDALRRQRLEVPETDDLLSTTELRIGVRSDPSANALRIRNNVADLRGDVDLIVFGTLARPTVQGTIELEPGGSLTLFDNKYRVERANLSFNNARRVDPAIDLVARTDVRNFGITLTIDGTLEKPSTRFSSDADLADLEILSLVATGTASSFDPTAATTPSPGQPVAPGQLASSLLASTAAGELSKRVGTLFGLDRFRISPLADAGQAFADVGVTVGKRLSKDVFVTYTTDATGNRHHIVQVEWQVRNDLVIVLTQTENNKYSIDAQWEKRF